MKLTIIIPVYNVEKYIEECLNSIYKGKLGSFEVICIDDKGNDKSIEIIKEYVRVHKINNLKIISHNENKGLSEARNTGIRFANGKYICFLDSDDMIDPNGLKRIIDYAIKDGLDIIEGNIKEIFETTKDINVENNNKNRSNFSIMTGDEYFYYSCKKSLYYPMAWCRVYRTEYLKSGYFFMQGLKFEDEEFSPRAIIGAKKIRYINEVFYIYRRREDSITTNMMKNNKWIENYLKIIKSLSMFSETIKKQKSYYVLKDRIANLALSILKNPVAYGTSDENLSEIINLIKKKKIYKIPQKSKNLLIKVQGIIMKYPSVFIRIYSKSRRGNE